MMIATCHVVPPNARLGGKRRRVALRRKGVAVRSRCWERNQCLRADRRADVSFKPEAKRGRENEAEGQIQLGVQQVPVAAA